MERLTVRIHGCDGSLWTVHGQGSGAEGVSMGKDQVEGLFDAPVRTAWKAGQRQRGGVMKGMWNDWRDLKLGFHLVAARVPGASQEDIMSRFRQAFAYEEDEWDHDAVLAKIEVISDTSTRFLDVQLYDEMQFNPGLDPLKRQHANPEFLLRSGRPFYYEPDVITTWSTGSSSGSGYIPVSNPTDTLMHQKWIGTRGQWTLPDVSWAGSKHHRVPGVSKLTGLDHSGRAILMPPITEIQGGFVVDLDTAHELMVRDAHDTNLLGQMPVPGMYFSYPIPPWTPPTQLPVSVTGAPTGGAMIQCVQPRLWQGPFGGQ